MLALLMVISFAACGITDSFTDVSTETKDNAEIQGTAENNVGNVEWREFLEDYEKWVDDYISIVNKQKENPTDISILSDYTKMLSDLTEWSTRADEVAESIKGTDDAVEYSKELLRIIEKLTAVNQ